MFRLVAASLGVGFASAAAGNVTTLCNALLTGRCFAYNSIWTATLPTQTQCENWFTGAGFPNGQDTDNSTNSIGCRQHFASLAVDAATDYNCQFASFNGGGVCGNALANTCDSILSICQGNPNLPAGFTSSSACQTNLTGLAAIFGSKDGVPGSGENSLNCRVYHAIAGTTVGAIHCAHTDSNGPCSGAVSTNGDHYCGVLENVCVGANQQYINHATCLGSFNCFPNGTGVAATVTNDRDSHQYHAQAASAVGLVHCQHGGPSGGGTVSTPRVAWQMLANNANCKTVAGAGYVSAQINIAFNNFSSADLLTIVPTDPNIAAYTSNPPNASNFDSCRIYHLSVATVLGVHCTHGDLLGGGQCPLGHPEVPACNAEQALCGTTNYATNAACEAAYGAYFAANKTGDPMAATQTMDDIACRMYWVTLGLIAKNGGMTNVTMQCASAKINGSMACTGMASPTAMAPTKSGAAPVALSAAVSFLMLLW